MLPNLRTFMFAAVMGLFLIGSAAVAFGTNPPNPCGNHGNNCQCETVDTGDEVSTEVVCASVADAYAKSFAAAAAAASAEATAETTATCEAAAASCEQSSENSADASATCGDVSVSCESGGDYVGGKLCADRRFKYYRDGSLKRTFCKKYVIPVTE